MEVCVEAGGGVQDEDEVGREIADNVTDQDGPDGDGEVDLLVPVLHLGCGLVSDHGPVYVSHYGDDLEVAVGDDAVGKCRYEDAVEVRETVATHPSDDGAGPCQVHSQLTDETERPPVSSM